MVKTIQAKTSSGCVTVVLNTLMEKTQMNVAQLSKNTGLAHTTITRLCSDPNSNPTIASIKKIADFFGITQNQLLGHEPLSDEGGTYHPNFENWSSVPILTEEQIIHWPDNIETIRELKKTDYIKTDLPINEEVFAIKAVDETLEPKFSNGTILIFDPQRNCRNKDYVLILMHGKKIPQVKQALTDGPDVYLKTINPEFPMNQAPIKYEKKECKILGVLIQAKSNYV